ncbi:hypothetical protein HK107_11305 [Parvularcula sp. ZS-1/3]|uniref:Protein PsiE n=1 Tax=Parvularcula mediterranea TaxID=2732508 RepID=A0A7Y3RNJ9_9PROT|nr:phosphate-starvation-inducible PsiE family protein [Parvularcula mediterranea]NNU16905.1 hypothetical protein [Parvularcula mediterranea]
MVTDIYERFSKLVAAILLAGAGVVILFSLGSFIVSLTSIFDDFTVVQDYLTFQRLFERILAVVIALELAHSVEQMASGARGVVQLRTVVLIGILAVVRKLIVLDIEQTAGSVLIGLGATVLALGFVYVATYWCDRSIAAIGPGEGKEDAAGDDQQHPEEVRQPL